MTTPHLNAQQANSEPSRLTTDVLRLRPLRSALTSPAFPLLLQAAAVVGLLSLAVIGFGVGRNMSGAELLTLRKTNLATLSIWGLWWPMMIVGALILGRLWCTVCPMELINRVGEAAGRWMGYRRLPLGKLLRSGWFIVMSYLVLQLLVAGFSIHRVPHSTSLLLLALFAGAFVTGLVFREPRSFCRAFCPAQALLSVYGRFTPLQLEARHVDACARCSTKDCVSAANRDRFDKRSCPSLLRPFNRTASDGCVLCLQCAKVCPHDNIGFGLVSPGAPVRRQQLLRPYEVGFVLIALGFVAHETIGESKWLDAWFHAPAKLLSLVTGLPFSWAEAAWFLGIFPLAVWALVATAAYAAGYRGTLRLLLMSAATAAAPIIAIGHLSKAVAKLAAWAGYLPGALRDPVGIDTLQKLTLRAPAPGALLSLSAIGVVLLCVISTGTWKAWRATNALPKATLSAARVGLLLPAALFTFVLATWVATTA